MRPQFLKWIFALALFVFVAAEPQSAIDVDAEKAALAPLQQFVGGWKGVGQVKRGSNQGAWTEAAEWAWQFKEGHAALVFAATDGKYFSSGQLTAGETPGTFTLQARPTDAGKEPAKEKAEADQFTGKLSEDGVLVLVNSTAEESQPARISIRMVAGGDRLVTLYERKVAGADRFVRLGEVGLTRKGSSFAKGNSGPECIVTGGHGSIQVQHAGKTYFVCCSGCRDLFNADPEAALEEYQARTKDKKSEE